MLRDPRELREKLLSCIKKMKNFVIIALSLNYHFIARLMIQIENPEQFCIVYRGKVGDLPCIEVKGKDIFFSCTFDNADN